MTKKLRFFLFVFFIVTISWAQPGNGHGNGAGNGGRGNGNCGNPPCGGPNQTVPLNADWLMYVGVIAGSYLTFSRKRRRS